MIPLADNSVIAHWAGRASECPAGVWERGPRVELEAPKLVAAGCPLRTSLAADCPLPRRGKLTHGGRRAPGVGWLRSVHFAWRAAPGACRLRQRCAPASAMPDIACRTAYGLRGPVRCVFRRLVNSVVRMVLAKAWVHMLPRPHERRPCVRSLWRRQLRARAGRSILDEVTRRCSHVQGGLTTKLGLWASAGGQQSRGSK